MWCAGWGHGVYISIYTDVLISFNPLESTYYLCYQIQEAGQGLVEYISPIGSLRWLESWCRNLTIRFDTDIWGELLSSRVISLFPHTGAPGVV